MKHSLDLKLSAWLLSAVLIGLLLGLLLANQEVTAVRSVRRSRSGGRRRELDTIQFVVRKAA